MGLLDQLEIDMSALDQIGVEPADSVFSSLGVPDRIKNYMGAYNSPINTPQVAVPDRLQAFVPEVQSVSAGRAPAAAAPAAAPPGSVASSVADGLSPSTSMGLTDMATTDPMAARNVASVAGKLADLGVAQSPLGPAKSMYNMLAKTVNFFAPKTIPEIPSVQKAMMDAAMASSMQTAMANPINDTGFLGSYESALGDHMDAVDAGWGGGLGGGGFGDGGGYGDSGMSGTEAAEAAEANAGGMNDATDGMGAGSMA